MAILDGVKEVVKAQVARNITNSVTHGLTKVAGNLFGVDLNINYVDNILPLPIWGGKYFTKNLDFPLGVENDPQQGHYIIFEIMKQDKAKLAAAKKEKTKSVKRNKGEGLGYTLSGVRNYSESFDGGDLWLEDYDWELMSDFDFMSGDGYADGGDYDGWDNEYGDINNDFGFGRQINFITGRFNISISYIYFINFIYNLNIIFWHLIIIKTKYFTYYTYYIFILGVIIFMRNISNMNNNICI